MVNVKDFNGANDSEIIQNAIDNRDDDGIVVIGPKGIATKPEDET